MLSTCIYIYIYIYTHIYSWVYTRVYAWWIWRHGDIPNSNDICNGKHTCSIFVNLSKCAVLWCVCMAFDTMCILNKLIHPYIHNTFYIKCPAPMRPQGMQPSMHAPRGPARLKLKSSNWLSKGYLMKSSQIRWKLDEILWTSNVNAIKSKGDTCNMEVWIFEFWCNSGDVRIQFECNYDNIMWSYDGIKVGHPEYIIHQYYIS